MGDKRKMTKIDIFSGFLGAGKTTLIKKLISEAYQGEKLVLIENEFGEIGIDGGFLRDAGIEITEMNSGCICCSLVGDFATALCKVLDELHPDRIIIEPSGVGKLSDVIKAVKGIEREDAELGSYTAIVDVNKCKMYVKNFGEFYIDQIKHASSIVLSHTGKTTDKKLADCVSLVREHNPTAVIVTTPWNDLTGAQLLEAMERTDTLEAELARLAEETEHHHHHHHHHEDGEECCCGHDHDHEHHHHHHEDGECCCCGHDHDGHHHHHHADEVFVSCGTETTASFDRAAMNDKLNALTDEDKYGIVLRAKGIVAATDGGNWIHFDYVPGEPDVREGGAAVIGRLCVIGSKLNIPALSELFGVELK